MKINEIYLVLQLLSDLNVKTWDKMPIEKLEKIIENLKEKLNEELK